MDVNEINLILLSPSQAQSRRHIGFISLKKKGRKL